MYDTGSCDIVVMEVAITSIPFETGQGERSLSSQDPRPSYQRWSSSYQKIIRPRNPIIAAAPSNHKG